MICRIKKTDIIVAIIVLLFFGSGFLFGIYKIGQQNGIKSQQNEILVLRQLNTRHLQKIDSLHIEISKLQKMIDFPEEKEKQIRKESFYNVELPKMRQEVNKYPVGSKERQKAMHNILKAITKGEKEGY